MDTKLVRCSAILSRATVGIGPISDLSGRDLIAVMNTHPSHRTSGEIVRYARAFAAGPQMIEALETALVALRSMTYKAGISTVIAGIEDALAAAKFGGKTQP